MVYLIPPERKTQHKKLAWWFIEEIGMHSYTRGSNKWLNCETRGLAPQESVK